MTESTPQSDDGQAEVEASRTCDFCGDTALSVRRVALHGDYERLRTPHAVQYSCDSCFEKKDRQRLGLDRG